MDFSQIKTPLSEITPFSKYFSLFLFIVLPFIGGLVGYNMANVQETMIPIVSKDSITGEVQKNKNLTEVTRVTEKDGRFAPDGNFLSDQELFKATGLPYVTSFSKDYPLYLLEYNNPTHHSIYKYNQRTQTYEPLTINVQEKAEGVISEKFAGITVLGWSDDLRYIALRPSPSEGVAEVPVYYIDTQNLDKGLIKVSDNFITPSIEGLVSSDYSKILGIIDTAISKETFMEIFGVNDLIVFDLNTLLTKSIYTHDGTKNTFLEPSGYGSGNVINARWIDDSTVELKTSTLENLKSYIAGNQSQESGEQYLKNLQTLQVKVD